MLLRPAVILLALGAALLSPAAARASHDGT